jgi:hypothetical protein
MIYLFKQYEWSLVLIMKTNNFYRRKVTPSDLIFVTYGEFILDLLYWTIIVNETFQHFGDVHLKTWNIL